MRALFRVDASTIIGSGHVIRCLTLAKAFEKKGWEILFCCREHKGHLIDWLEEQKIKLIKLPLLPESPAHSYACWLGATELQDVEALQLQLDSPVDLLVIDHYGLSATFEQAMQGYFRKLFVIDDLANRRHQCDYLLDQNLYPDYQTRYEGSVNVDCQLLLGPEYALLRPEFLRNRPSLNPSPLTFLVFFGGTDLPNLTCMAIKALQTLKIKAFRADIVIGLANPHHQQVKELCAADKRFQLHVQTDQMAQLMQKSTLMIGAGGTTHWERCASALPALVVTLAENQIAGTLSLAAAGVCDYLGDAAQVTTAQMTQAISGLLAQPEYLESMRKKASQVISPDGGCNKIVDLITTDFMTNVGITGNGQ